MAILYVGIDLAKNVFAVHGVDEDGKPALVRPSLARAKLRGKKKARRVSRTVRVNVHTEP